MSSIENILIVGNEPFLVETIEKQADPTGRRVLTAPTPAEALARAGQEGVDLVVMGAPTVAAQGREGAADLAALCPEALFILICGPDFGEAPIADPPFRVQAFLRKPLQAGEIQTAIESALQYKRLRQAYKLSELALLESKGRLATLVVNALVGIAIIQDHQVVYQNPAQQTIFQGRQAPFSLNDFSCVNDQDLQKVKDVYAGMLAEKMRTAELDFRFSLADSATGKPVTKSVQCRASVYRHEGENAILLSMMDITHARELENLIMIKDKMTSLGRVAAGIAHEIRNPLTGINSYLFTLENLTAGDSVAPENLALIQRITSQIQVASNKIEAVIKRVLDFSKPSKPKMEMIRINDAIEEAVGLSAVTVRKKGITLEKALQTAMPLCYGDTHLMEQVVLNLINNAAIAVESGGENKHIRVASYAGKGRVYVSVSDSGPGIPADIVDKIFDPFFTTRADGSGIGLSISQRIVADHGGTIKVGEGVGGGAEFTIDLPVEKRMYPR